MYSSTSTKNATIPAKDSFASSTAVLGMRCELLIMRQLFCCSCTEAHIVDRRAPIVRRSYLEAALVPEIHLSLQFDDLVS